MKKSVGRSILVFIVALSFLLFSLSIVAAIPATPQIIDGGAVCQTLPCPNQDCYLRNTIRWNLVPGATSYEIYYGKQAVFDPANAETHLAGTSTTNSFSESGATVRTHVIYPSVNGGTFDFDYSYWVKAIDASGASAFSSTFISIDEPSRDNNDCTQGDIFTTTSTPTPPPTPPVVGPKSIPITSQRCPLGDNDIILRIAAPTNALGEVWNGANKYPIEICFSKVFESYFKKHGLPANPHMCKTGTTNPNRVLVLSDTTNAKAWGPHS